MKTLHSRAIHFAALAVLISCWSLSRAQTIHHDLAWREFKSEAGRFSVKFPGDPKVGQTSFAEGPVKATRYTHSFELDPGLSFEVDYMEVETADTDLTMEGGISGLIRSSTARGATVIANEKIVSGSCEGREATLVLTNHAPRKPGFEQARIFNSGSRYYFMVFVGREDNEATREIGRTFLDSFAITGGCNNLTAPVEEPAVAKTSETVEGVIDAETGWRNIESTDLGFKVLMPGAVRHDTEQGQVKPFPITHHTYIYSGGGTVYSAEVFSEYPPGFRQTQVAYQTTLDLTLYALKKNLEPEGFVLTPLRDLKVGVFPGREFLLASEKANAYGRVQLYVTSKRTYVFIAFAHNQGVAVKLLNSFFGSIRVSTR